MSRKQKYLMNLTLGLLTGLFIVPMVLEWLGFSLAAFYNQTFDGLGMKRGLIGAALLIVITYVAGKSFIKDYRSIEE